MSDPKHLPVAPHAPKPLPTVAVIALFLLLALALLPLLKLIRATSLEVSKYHVSTFAAYAKEAINAGQYAEAIEICAGALQSGFDRGDYLGQAHLLMAAGHEGLGQYEESLAELRKAVAFWETKYYYASEEDRARTKEVGERLGRHFLDQTMAAQALSAFSLAGCGSGRPLDYLRTLQATLSPADQVLLWGDKKPLLLLKEFSQAAQEGFARLVEEQGRKLVESAVGTPVSLFGQGSAHITLGPSVNEGLSRYSTAVYLPITQETMGIRAYVREVPAAETALFLAFWLDSAHKSASVVEKSAEALEGGWKCYEIIKNFHEMLENQPALRESVLDDAILSQVALEFPPGQAREVWVDRIELFSGD